VKAYVATILTPFLSPFPYKNCAFTGNEISASDLGKLRDSLLDTM
jgi:hypothetical protein